jgi:hypothetical protein
MPIHFPHNAPRGTPTPPRYAGPWTCPWPPDLTSQALTQARHRTTRELPTDVSADRQHQNPGTDRPA